MDIHQLKSGNDIGRVIGRYVALERKGGKLTGLCPFHDDHHPSLTVDLRRQTFACYACGAFGDVITFLQRIERCSFSQALERLGDERGKVKGERRNTGGPKNLSPFPSHLSPANEEYLRLLLPYHPGHPELTDTYLAFEVGMSPVLVPPRWKMMSGRIVFPIRDAEGKLTGFAGKKLTVDNGQLTTKEGTDQLSTLNCQLSTAKYVNTSAADGYRKGEHLYGLYRAKEAMVATGEVYLTEGYRDALAMHAAGFTQSVALGGTALAVGQRQLLQAHGVKKAFLVLDADPAGKAAAAKAGALLEADGIEAVTVGLPEGEDPDSLFRTLGREAFRRFMHSAAHPPHETEQWLSAALQRYPEATCRLDDGVDYPVADVIHRILEHDGIPAPDLSLLPTSPTSPPDPLSTREGENIAGISSPSLVERGSGGEVGGGRGADTVLYYFYLYCEACLREEIEGLFARGGRQGTPAEEHLQSRLALYRDISGLLHRPGVV